MSEWTKAELTRLRDLVAEGFSASQISAKLSAEFGGGRSRNSVISRISRSKGKLGRLQTPPHRPAKRAVKPVSRHSARPPLPRAGQTGASSPHTNAPVNNSSASRAEGAPDPFCAPPATRQGRANMPDGQSPLQAASVIVDNLPAPLPITFLEALFADRCLHFVGDPLGIGGPDMPVCGAERARSAPSINRYCCRHLASQHQVAA